MQEPSIAVQTRLPSEPPRWRRGLGENVVLRKECGIPRILRKHRA